MSSRHDTGWNGIYHRLSPEHLPWELGKPRKVLTELVDSRRILPGKALDLCCGVGTNPIYLAKKGFDVTALDISDKAVEYAKEQVNRGRAYINLIIGNFLNLPIKKGEFDFVFDFGCFHHVEIRDRINFIAEVHRVLKTNSSYCLVCFSRKNGLAWNHFSREQIIKLFANYFDIEWIRHVSSLEGDKVIRYFYEVFMNKLNNNTL